MLDQAAAHAIFEKVLRYSQADETEVLIAGGQSALTRFANNTIHQNVAEENYFISVRTVFGGRTARASTNKFDDESLRRTVAAAASLSKIQHPDAELLPMASDSGQRDIPERFFAETAAIGPAERAAAVEKIVAIAHQEKLTTAGICSVSEGMEAIFNSRGLAAFHAQTSSEISVTMLGEKSSGWQKANSPDYGKIDAAAL